MNITNCQIDSAWLDTEGAQTESDVQGILKRFVESLSTDQLKQLCEAKGLSVVEWVELDAEDIKIFPMIRAFIMTNNGLRRFEKIKGVYCFTTERQTHIGNKTVVDNDVTHWCKLPQRKESK